MYSIKQTEYTQKQTAKRKLSLLVYNQDGTKLAEWSPEVKPDMPTEKVEGGTGDGAPLLDYVVAFPPELLKPSMTLSLYPQGIKRIQPGRTKVSQALGYTENYQPKGDVHSWGHGLPQWTITGHTGYGTHSLTMESGMVVDVDGYLGFAALHIFIETYFRENLHRMRVKHEKGTVRMLLYNWTDAYQDLWYVEPVALPVKTRGIDKPLYYNYELQFIGVTPFTSKEKINDELANAVGDYEARRKAIAENIAASKSKLSEWTDKIKKFRSEIATVVADLETIQEGVEDFFNAPREFFTQVEGAISDLTSLRNDIIETVLSPLDEVYGLANDIQGTLCALNTLLAIPSYPFSDLGDDWSSFWDSVQGGGCGTTLQPPKVNYND